MEIIETYNQEVSRHFRFNFTVNLIDVAFYMFGYSFLSPATILPVFVSHFTENPILLGLIPFLSTSGFLLPQLFASNIVERTPVKKFFPFNLGFFLERLPLFLIVAITYFFAGSDRVAALAMFFILYAWHNFGAGFIMVGWQDMIAKIIPVGSRGKFFGLSNFIGNITGIAGASAVAFLLIKYPFPIGYVIAFGGASICILISWFFLGMSREPRDPVTKPTVTTRDYFKSLPSLVRSNLNFRNFLIAQIISSFGLMASGFIMVFALSRWNIPDGRAASFTIALLVGQSIANLVLGPLADRKGHKIILEISLLFNIASFLLALISQSPAWFFAVFALRGVSLSGSFISGMSFPLEFCEPKDRPTFIGMAGTIPGIAGAIAPILGGILAKSLGYSFLFILSTGVALIALSMMHWTVHDPRHMSSQ